MYTDLSLKCMNFCCCFKSIILRVINPLHVGISLRLALKDTLSGSLIVTLADESWKSPLIEDKNAINILDGAT